MSLLSLLLLQCLTLVTLGRKGRFWHSDWHYFGTGKLVGANSAHDRAAVARLTLHLLGDHQVLGVHGHQEARPAALMDPEGRGLRWCMNWSHHVLPRR